MLQSSKNKSHNIHLKKNRKRSDTLSLLFVSVKRNAMKVQMSLKKKNKQNKDGLQNRTYNVKCNTNECHSLSHFKCVTRTVLVHTGVSNM